MSPDIAVRPTQPTPGYSNDSRLISGSQAERLGSTTLSDKASPALSAEQAQLHGPEGSKWSSSLNLTSSEKLLVTSASLLVTRLEAIASRLGAIAIGNKKLLRVVTEPSFLDRALHGAFQTHDHSHPTSWMVHACVLSLSLSLGAGLWGDLTSALLPALLLQIALGPGSAKGDVDFAGHAQTAQLEWT